MTFRSPALAFLWENWRLTRVEAAWKLALGIVGGLAALALSAAIAPNDAARDAGVALALILIFLPSVMGWWSIGSLNRIRPGFPFYLLYTQPIRTSVLVGVPMAYLAAVPAASFLVSALLLRVISGYSFPLVPVAAWIAAINLAHAPANWPIRNPVLRLLGNIVIGLAWFNLAMQRLTAVEIPDTFDWPPHLWPTLFNFPITDYAVIALIGIASFGVTVAGVARQRRGDGWMEVPSAPRDGFWDQLVNLFRFPCPTSSATRAQVWLDLKSNGLPVLTIGVALAIVILLLSAVAGPIDAAFTDEIRARLSCTNRDCFYVRPMPALLAPLSVLSVLFLAGNAFGIRRRQGRAYMGAFEAGQAYGTAQLAVLKLLVKSVCVLAALIAIGVSVSISLRLLGDAVFIQMWTVPLSSQLGALQGGVAALTGYEQLALAVVTAVGVFVWVAAFAVLGALWTRYSRRANIAASSLLLSGLALALLALAERNGIVSPLVVDAIFAAARLIVLAAMMFTTAYVFWSGFAERVLTIRYAGGAVAVSAAFGAAWLTVLHMTGVQLAGMSEMGVVWMLSPVLLSLTVSALAPWSLSRIRHT